MLLAKKDSIQQLIDIIDSQNHWYVGVIVALVGAFIGFQWYLNNKQADKIKKDIENDLAKRYGFIKVNSRLDTLERKISNEQFDLKHFSNESLTVTLKRIDQMLSNIALSDNQAELETIYLEFDKETRNVIFADISYDIKFQFSEDVTDILDRLFDKRSLTKIQQYAVDSCYKSLEQDKQIIEDQKEQVQDK